MRGVKTLLNKATDDEKKALAEILNANSDSPDDIIDRLCWNCQSIFGYIFSSDPTYKTIVQQIAKKLNVKYGEFTPIGRLEIRIAQKIMETVWEKMTPKQRKKMEAEMRKTAQEFDNTGSLIGSVGIFGTLTAAQLSGFGVYLLASTSLGAITGAIGITLPFAVYTTMSSAIAVIIGPVGWIGAGLFAIWKLTGANYKRLIPAILYLCVLRAKQKNEFK